MIKEFRFSLEYAVSGQSKVFEGWENDDFSTIKEASEEGIKVTLVPKKELQLKNAYLKADYVFEEEDRIFVNGYQSWTTSREYTKNDIQKGLLRLAKYQPVRGYSALFGDYDFQKYYSVPGKFHSYSYSYINRKEDITLFGTLTERTGYTVIHYDMPANKIAFQKDIDGVTTQEEYLLFDLFFAEGTYDEVFDAYFKKLALPPLKIKHMAGYTSWYNYYGGITEEILNRDIDGLATVKESADIFQIDDGYQTKTGDWTSVKKDLYPHGMNYLTEKIHRKGFKAGLWLAPFNAAKSSRVFAEHPDWFIKDAKGKYQLGSIAWGGAYTLDFYIEEAADYIRNFFNVVLNEWNFDMVKLDFLYSVCQTPRRNKSRGQIMCEAMDFLRECVGNKLLLGCGVPLFPAFGKVDACRISCDVGASFKPAWYNSTLNHEVPSTRCAMINTIFRRHLNGRAFVNDPDVFYLRDSDVRKFDKLAVRKSKLIFNEEQKITHATINNMCGDVLFVSDNVGDFTDERRKQLKKFFRPTDKKVTKAQYVSKDEIEIYYTEKDKRFRMLVNLHTGKNVTQKL